MREGGVLLRQDHGTRGGFLPEDLKWLWCNSCAMLAIIERIKCSNKPSFLVRMTFGNTVT